MLIVGERINSSRSSINEAIEKKHFKFIQEEAIKQIKSGANMLDVNCGTNIRKETENMLWLIQTIQEVSDVPLVIDSPNPETISEALKICKRKAIINSITLEKKRYENILPLVKKYNTGVIALTITETGMPASATERFEIAKNIVNLVKEYNIKNSDLYIDPLVRPLSVEQAQALEFLKSIQLIKSLNVNVICGLSNISFGLPERGLINSTFLALAIYCGLDAAILDPTDKRMISTLRSVDVLLNKDEFCIKYIQAYKEGLI